MNRMLYLNSVLWEQFDYLRTSHRFIQVWWRREMMTSIDLKKKGLCC